MNNVRDICDVKTTTRQACEWLILLETGGATADDRARCDAWLREHPGHRAAFDNLKGTWGRLYAAGEYAGDAGLIEPEPDPKAVAKYLSQSARRHRRGRRFAWSAAAALFVATVAGMLMYPLDSSTLYRTGVGEQEKITLPDRSTVQLNTDTELRVIYSDGARNIELFRGEAYFDVEHDPDRPFVVNAGLGAITAVGTGFVVQMKQNEIVAVTVTEGIVEVGHSPRRKPAAAAPELEVIEPAKPRLSKGQRLEYDREVGRPTAMPQEELDRALAWRQGLLIFDGEPLENVIQEVGRYTDTRLIISDGELRQLHVSGTFRAGDIKALLEILENGFGIAVERHGSRTVYLIKRRSATAG